MPSFGGAYIHTHIYIFTPYLNTCIYIYTLFCFSIEAWNSSLCPEHTRRQEDVMLISIIPSLEYTHHINTYVYIYVYYYSRSGSVKNCTMVPCGRGVEYVLLICMCTCIYTCICDVYIYILTLRKKSCSGAREHSLGGLSCHPSRNTYVYINIFIITFVRDVEQQLIQISTQPRHSAQVILLRHSIG